MLGQGLNSLIPSGTHPKDEDDKKNQSTYPEEDEKLLSTSPHQAPVLIPVGYDNQTSDQDFHKRIEEKLGISQPSSSLSGPNSTSGNDPKEESPTPKSPSGNEPADSFEPLSKKVASDADKPFADSNSNPYQAHILDAKETSVKKTGAQTSGAVFLIETDKIKPNPHQPRKTFDDGGIKDLGVSIRQYGILQPLVVSKIEKEVPGGTEVFYQLIAGERRLLAAKQIGMERVPVIIRTISESNESLELAIIENLQREDLNAIEMARAFARLQDEFRLTQREIASKLGKSRETVANTLRLLDLPTSMQDAIAKGRISESHGRLLLTVKEPSLQEKLFKDLLDSSMTTRELHKRAKGGRGTAGVSKGETKDEPPKLSPDLVMFQENLSSTLGTPVTINKAGPGGKITINFYSEEELKSIMDQLKKISGE